MEANMLEGVTSIQLLGYGLDVRRILVRFPGTRE
jgi:hypothetical protein